MPPPSRLSRRERAGASMTKVARVVAVLVVGLVATTVGQAPGPRLLPAADAPTPQAQCGTSAAWEMNGRIRPQARASGLADGEALKFQQGPPLLFADYTGPVTLRDFSVVGDFAAVQFLRVTRDFPEGQSETWTRVSTRSVSGQLIS